MGEGDLKTADFVKLRTSITEWSKAQKIRIFRSKLFFFFRVDYSALTDFGAVLCQSYAIISGFVKIFHDLNTTI